MAGTLIRWIRCGAGYYTGRYKGDLYTIEHADREDANCKVVGRIWLCRVNGQSPFEAASTLRDAKERCAVSAVMSDPVNNQDAFAKLTGKPLIDIL